MESESMCSSGQRFGRRNEWLELRLRYRSHRRRRPTSSNVVFCARRQGVVIVVIVCSRVRSFVLSSPPPLPALRPVYHSVRCCPRRPRLCRNSSYNSINALITGNLCIHLFADLQDWMVSRDLFRAKKCQPTAGNLLSWIERDMIVYCMPADLSNIKEDPVKKKKKITGQKFLSDLIFITKEKQIISPSHRICVYARI